MDSMREMLRKNLGRSLEALPELDRLTAAWPVACGPALAEKGEIVAYANGIVQVAVLSSAWLEQMRAMHEVLQRELGRIAAVPLTGIHFEVKRPPSIRPDRKRIR
jgi:predicted nucleic acid-binding Zn ribbon protein